MSARGRHRRPRPRRIARATLVTAAGGAGIALPFLSVGQASAASVGTWDKVAECESTNNWSINSGNGFFGGLQFTQDTWKEFGGTQYAPRADQASKEQQIAIAEKVLKVQGPSAWPVCSVKAGLTKGSPAPQISTAGAKAPAPAKKKAEPKPAPAPAEKKTETYTVVRGDTLDKIAKAKHADGGWQRIYQDNREVVGSDPTRIFPGQKLSLGGKTETYTVVRGDTLDKIAKAKHADGGWQRIYQDNREVIGGDPARIFPGQKLSLGGGAAEPKQQAPKAQAPKPAAPKPAAPKAQTAQKAGTSGFTAPVANTTIGTPYHRSGPMWSSGYHTGTDFPVPTGTSVKAIGPGKVVTAGWGGAYGNQVVIRHADGKYSQYGHMSSLSVSAGQTVSGGQQIGLSGSTGNVSGPHLHFEVRTGPDYGSDIDPVAYLRGHGVTL